MILFGGFVEVWGRAHSLTLRHYAQAFSVGWSEFGIVWSGAAWNGFSTTFRVAAVSAVPTALLGLLIAWLLARQDFAGKRAFEFGAMLSFAIPGTVIEASDLTAFNVPPVEITGTGRILVIAFVFRNMLVGIRAGVANFARLDPALDEASLNLAHRHGDHTAPDSGAAPAPRLRRGAGLQLRHRAARRRPWTRASRCGSTKGPLRCSRRRERSVSGTSQN